MVDSVITDSDIEARGDEVAVDGRAAGLDFAPECAGYRRAETHGFVDAGSEVAAVV